MWHLAVVAAATFLWQAFPDGPLAFYIINALFVAFLCVRAALKEPMWWQVYAYGAVMALLTAGCGGLFIAKADGAAFLCDKGTGLPVSLISGIGFLVLIVVLLKRKKT